MNKLLAFAGALLALALISPAFAQTAATATAAPTGIAVGGFIANTLAPLVEALASGIATAVIAWAALWAKAKFHVDIEAQHRDAMHSAIMTGINLGLSKVETATGTLTISVKNAVIGQAISYVLQSVPDALSYLGVDASKLEPLVASKLSAILGASATVATIPAGPAAGGASA